MGTGQRRVEVCRAAAGACGWGPAVAQSDGGRDSFDHIRTRGSPTMPPQRPGLEQGLAALVGPGGGADRAGGPRGGTAWEYAAIVRGQRGLRIEVGGGDPLRGYRRRRIRGMRLVALLGLLGAAGWELVAVEGRRFYLKRAVPLQ